MAVQKATHLTVSRGGTRGENGAVRAWLEPRPRRHDRGVPAVWSRGRQLGRQPGGRALPPLPTTCLCLPSEEREETVMKPTGASLQAHGAGHRRQGTEGGSWQLRTGSMGLKTGHEYKKGSRINQVVVGYVNKYK